MSGEKSPPSTPSTDENSATETPLHSDAEQSQSTASEMAEDAKEMAEEAREQAEEAKDMAQAARDMAKDIKKKAKATRTAVDDSITTSAGLMITHQREEELSGEFTLDADDSEGSEDDAPSGAENVDSPLAQMDDEGSATPGQDLRDAVEEAEASLSAVEEGLAEVPEQLDAAADEAQPDQEPTSDTSTLPETKSQDKNTDNSASDDASAASAAEGSASDDASASFFEEGERIDAEGESDADDDDLTPMAGMEDELPWGSTHGPVVPPEWEFVLPLSVVLISWLVMSTFWDDVRYFFTPRAPISLGTAKEGCTKEMYQKMKHNRLAQIKGIYAQPGMTAQARVRFHQQNYAVVMGCRLILAMRKEKFKQVAESYFGVTGRLMRSDRTPATRTLEKYYGSSGILKFGKGTYLLYVDERPRHQWWLVVIYLVLGALVLYNAWRLLYILWNNHIKGTEGEAAQ